MNDSPCRAEHTDLDHLIGTWQEDPEFDLAIADFAFVDEDASPLPVPATSGDVPSGRCPMELLGKMR